MATWVKEIAWASVFIFLFDVSIVRYACSECLYAALFATFFDVFMPP